VPDSVQVRGNSDDLRDMVRNLLENAVVHGRGKVSVRIPAPEKTSSAITIDVSDEGPGVTSGQEEAVFQRFRRLNVDTPGSGLGLAIVRHVARSHGGDAIFTPGAGRVVVNLPLVTSADGVDAQAQGLCPAAAGGGASGKNHAF
jgi:two-component system, OmpR family, sensor histidine kinase TctE